MDILRDLKCKGSGVVVLARLRAGQTADGLIAATATGLTFYPTEYCVSPSP